MSEGAGQGRVDIARNAATMMPMQPIESLDRAVSFFFSTHQVEALNLVVIGITNLGGYYALVPLTIAFTILLRRVRGGRTALLYAVTALLTWGLCAATQYIVLRPRPDVAYSLVPIPTVPSYPSGHTMNSLVDYGLFAVLLTSGMPAGLGRFGIRFVCFFLPFLIGFTRLYLVVHFLSDVLAGWLGGAAVLLIAASFDVAPLAEAPATSDNRR